jgi:hypothetical protein
MIRAAALMALVTATQAAPPMEMTPLMKWAADHSPYGFDIYLDGKIWLSAGSSATGAKYAISAEEIFNASSRTVTTWIRGDFSRDKTVPYRSSMEKITFFCDNKTMTHGTTVYYRADQTVLNQLSAKYSADDVVPGTVGEVWLELACQK